MKLNYSAQGRLSLTSVMACLASITALAQSPEPVFQLPSDPNIPVISYTETPEMLGNPDRTPRVQVFSDGLVLVHYPVYMKKAGDYQMQLNQGQLSRLIRDVTQALDFDESSVGQARKAASQARQAQTGNLTYRSDDTLEEIAVTLESYQAAPGAPARAINQHISWRNIKLEAQEFPDIEALQDLSLARESILALLEDKRLVEIAAPVVTEAGR